MVNAVPNCTKKLLQYFFRCLCSVRHRSVLLCSCFARSIVSRRDPGVVFGVKGEEVVVCSRCTVFVLHHLLSVFVCVACQLNLVG